MLYQTQDTVSVVICAYTEARWNALLAAVQSAIMQTHPAQEIILVIDHNPALFERVQPVFAGLGLTIIENKFGRGIAGARNSGILAASGTVVAFLDDDAVAYPDWVANMLESYRNPQVLGVGGAIEPLWETARPNWFPTEFYWVVGCSYRGMPLEAQPVRNLIGANMSFRRDVFEQVGYFEESLGHVGKKSLGCEETELSIRVRQRWPEKILLYNPYVRVQHNVSSQRTRWNYLRTRCYNEGLSKAIVSRSVGAKDSLSSEWQYTLKVLPGGVVRGLGDSFKGDRSGLGRAGTITAGLAFTTFGYLVGTISTKLSEKKAKKAVRASKVMPEETELSLV